MTISLPFRGMATLICAPFITAAYSLSFLIAVFVFRKPASSLKKIPSNWARALCNISGVKVVVDGEENIPKDTGCIFVANHSSQFDIFSFQGFFPGDFRWLAKQELFKIPLLGKAMAKGGHISINRSNGREAVKSLSMAATKIKAGTSVLIFPEGTRSPTGSLGPFKSGAFTIAIKSGAPIIPIAFIGSHNVLPKGRFLSNPGTITIRVGKSIDTSLYNLSQKKELATQTRSIISNMLEDN